MTNTDPIKALVERLTDNLGWSERYEIEFSQVAASDLREVLNILGTIDLKHMAGAAKRVCHHHINEMECPNLKCTHEGMDGERYRCEICLLSFFLDYEEMK